MSEISLEQLVDELVSLNNEKLARRVVETSDVQWCLSELQDMLADDVVIERWVKPTVRLPINPGEPYGRRYVVAANSITTFLAMFEHFAADGHNVLRWKWWDGAAYDGPPIVAWIPLPDAPKDMEKWLYGKRV